MRIHATVTAFVVSSLLLSSTAFAQQRHIVDTVNMTRAVAAKTATDQQNRDVITNVLRQPQVQVLARQMGLDVTRAEGALSTLSGTELTRIADQARATNTQLAGGSNTVIISTTTLLLILIIVILLAN